MTKISPLAPQSFPNLPPIKGVRLGAVEAAIKYQDRKDLAVILFDQPASIAGVFTKSLCSSAPVDWCRKQLSNGYASALVVNSGNANAFTGQKGVTSVNQTAQAASSVFSCPLEQVFLASTGVIGEPLDASSMASHLENAKNEASQNAWECVAKAIMTTDTYHKMASTTFDVDGKHYTINGIAKGAGMIQPDMATMLSFLVTDFPVQHSLLQNLLLKAVEPSFNSISVDSDTSTSDTVLLFSALNGAHPIDDPDHIGIQALSASLTSILHDLAMQIVRDGEGATKHIEVRVTGAKSKKSARTIALAIANSPLVKTAIAGQDANWGRVVMAVGKAGEPADRDKLSISFNQLLVAQNGQRVEGYSEKTASKIMENEMITIAVDVGVGNFDATVWSCDLTADYIAINADYRS